MPWPDLLHAIGRALQFIGWAFLPGLLLPFFALLFTPKGFWADGLKALVTIIDKASYGLGEIVKWALPLLVLSVAFSVFALSIFGLSWTKLFESAEYFHASVIMLGAAATLLAGQHVRVDVFHVKMSDQGRALIDFCGFYVLLVPVSLIILWNSQSFLTFSWLIFEGSAETDGIRGEYLLKTTISIFCITMILQGLAIAIRAAFCLRGLPGIDRAPHTSPYFRIQELES